MGVARTLRKRSHGWLVWVGVLIAVALVVFTVMQRRRTAPITVRVHRVEQGPVRDLVASIAAGRVAAQKEVTLRAEGSGTVVKLHHRRGDVVAANEPLITFDEADLKSRLKLAELGVSLGKAQLAQAEANAKVAARNAARAKQLGAAGAMSGAEVENVEAQLEAAQKAVGAASAVVSQGSGSVELAKVALRKAVVKAPFGGVVLTTNVEEGDILPPGAPILAMADASALHVDVAFDELDLGKILVGREAEISLDAFADRLRGSVQEIAPSITLDLKGNRSVMLKVSIPVDARLRIGMSADVDVVVARRDDVLWVPPVAVLGRGAERTVYVVQNGLSHKRTIEVGIATWEAVEVTKGLAAGELVALDPSQPGLTDGARVLPEQSSKEPALKVGSLP